MATHEPLAFHQHFVEEINYDDIEKLEMVGKGSFGIVYKGKWRNKLVAVKHIEESGRKTFAMEIRQMSRVSHPNIVKLYGACTKNPVCLIMEYAECGSLYNVLHGRPSPEYNAGHAMSWILQCAEAVAYLHNMKPKALVHRDLKPPNLLLQSEGRVLKICDFGTACDLKTCMTNNKGSAAWMAPEVFEDKHYTEKCDVFSWGIILWEVLSRQKPFNEIGGSAFRIMWSVHQGRRPPFIEGCPKPLESLMIRCWSKDIDLRPSMNEVVKIISTLFQFFPGYEEPLVYLSRENSYGSELDEIVADDSYDIPDSLHIDIQPSSTCSLSGVIAPPDTKFSQPLTVDTHIANGDSWANNLVELPSDTLKIIPRQKLFENNDENTDDSLSNEEEEGGASTSAHDNCVNDIYLMLDQQFRPIEPDPSSEEGIKIFEEHKRMAKEYFEVQTELVYTLQKKQQLADELSRYESSLSSIADQEEEEKKRLQDEKKHLINMYNRLKGELELIENSKPSHPEDEWELLSDPDKPA